MNNAAIDTGISESDRTEIAAGHLDAWTHPFTTRST